MNIRSLLIGRKMSGAKIALVAIFVAASAFRVYLGATCEFLPNFSDMHDYNELAVEGGFNTYLPPLYPLFLRLVYTIFGNYNYKAVYVVQALITSLAILLIYDTVKRVSNEVAAFSAAVICAIYPNFIAYSLTTMTEALSIFIVVLLVWLLFKPFDDTKKAITLGCVLAAGIFIKSAILFFVPATMLTSRKRLVQLLVLIALLAPWIVRNAVVHQKVAPVSDTGALNFYATYNPAATGSKHVDAERTPLKTYDHDQVTYVREALKFIVHNKWKTMDITYNKLSLLLSRGWDTFVLRKVVGKSSTMNNIMLYAYVPVAVLGFIGLARLYSEHNRIIAYMMASYLLFSIVLAIFKFRYRVLIEPMLIMYTAMLIGSACERIYSRKSRGS
jgi:4-amino-4-deoxy-L-arabinose transferase-like glycosyltransferase